MESNNQDAPLLENLVESLQPLNSDDDSILSTLEFIKTVVAYDFPAEAFLCHPELFDVILFHNMA